jgi:hypothetical protein
VLLWGYLVSAEKEMVDMVKKEKECAGEEKGAVGWIKNENEKSLIIMWMM